MKQAPTHPSIHPPSFTHPSTLHAPSTHHPSTHRPPTTTNKQQTHNVLPTKQTNSSNSVSSKKVTIPKQLNFSHRSNQTTTDMDTEDDELLSNELDRDVSFHLPFLSFLFSFPFVSSLGSSVLSFSVFF